MELTELAVFVIDIQCCLQWGRQQSCVDVVDGVVNQIGVVVTFNYELVRENHN
jgi:hypothetical protein